MPLDDVVVTLTKQATRFRFTPLRVLTAPSFRFVNNPVDGLGLGVEVPNVFRDRIVANCFKIPAASVFLSAKRRFR